MPSDAVIHIWFNDHLIGDALKQGRRVIRSNAWYLDVSNPGKGRYRWMETWIDFYEHEPVPPGLSQEEENRMLGGEACMWSESVDSNNFDSFVWPRTSAAAERLWSDRGRRDSNEAKERLYDHGCRMVRTPFSFFFPFLFLFPFIPFFFLTSFQFLSFFFIAKEEHKIQPN